MAESGSGHTEAGVLVVAVGSTHAAANARTASLAATLSGQWAAVRVAYATGPQPSVADGIEQLRAAGVRRIVMAPWFIAPGRITDRVAGIAASAGAVLVASDGSAPVP